MNDESMSPDERVFRAHLERPAFRAGVGRGRWRLVDIAWPTVFIAIAAAPRDSAPNEFLLRFDLSNYPTAAPTAGLWDTATGAVLAADQRPKGHRQTLAFRSDWQNGEALYLPCDRRAIDGHAAWATQAPWAAWAADSDITMYLAQVSDLLTAEDYDGV